MAREEVWGRDGNTRWLQMPDERFSSGPLAFCAWEARARFSDPEFRILG